MKGGSLNAGIAQAWTGVGKGAESTAYDVDVGGYTLVSKVTTKGSKRKGEGRGSAGNNCDDGGKQKKPVFGQYGNLDKDGVPIDDLTGKPSTDERDDPFGQAIREAVGVGAQEDMKVDAVDPDTVGEAEQKAPVRPEPVKGWSQVHTAPEHWGAKSFWDTDESAPAPLAEARDFSDMYGKGKGKGKKGKYGKFEPYTESSGDKPLPNPRKPPVLPDDAIAMVQAAKAAFEAAGGVVAPIGASKDAPAVVQKPGWNRKNRWAKAKAGAEKEKEKEKAPANGAAPGAAVKRKEPEENVTYWKYFAADGKPIGIRKLPGVEAERTGALLQSGEVFSVVEEKLGSGEAGIIFLKLANNKGWLFDRKPGVGVLCFQATADEEAKRRRWSANDEEEEHPLVGTWTYGIKKPTQYHIVKQEDGKLRFDGPAGTGKVSGLLKPIEGFNDAWKQADLTSEGAGKQIGTIRLFFDKKNNTLTSNFKRDGTTKWGEDVKATKVYKAKPAKVVKPPSKAGEEGAKVVKPPHTNGAANASSPDEIPPGYTGPLIDKEFIEYQTLKQQPISKLKTLAKYHTISLVGMSEKSEIVSALLEKGIPDKVEVKVMKKVPAPPKVENLERRKLKEKLFNVVDLDIDQYLNRKEMKNLASVLGFDGEDGEWAQEYSKLCENTKADEETGIPQAAIFELLDDESDTGLHCTDEDMWRVIGTLQARAEASAKAEADALVEAKKKAEEDMIEVEKARQMAFAAAEALAAGKPAQAPTPKRPELKRLFFLGCDKDSDQHLKKDEMRTLAEASGFEGDDEEWTEEYERMCGDYGADPAKGIPEEKIMSLLDDESDEGLFLDDESLLTIVMQLEEAALEATRQGAMDAD
jgi:Ca2+-binding EF-hand superfamily protein